MWAMEDLSAGIESLEIKPYQFEPLKRSISDETAKLSDSPQSDSSDPSELDTDTEEEDDPRLGNTTWCSCGMCQPMQNSWECICCRELRPVEAKFDNHEEDLDCITELDAFHSNCLNKDVIEVNMYQFVEQEGPIDDNEPINKLYRYVSYRTFTRWIHHILGKKKRLVIPACAVSQIRQAFPSEEYTGFKYARP